MNPREAKIREGLSHVLTEKGIDVFLGVPNSSLQGFSPQQLLDLGEYDRLDAYVASLHDSSFS